MKERGIRSMELSSYGGVIASYALSVVGAEYRSDHQRK